MQHLAWMLLCVAAVLPSRAAAITESFAQDPQARGWRIFGDGSLFTWNATNANLEVTWDSSRTNSLFYRSLGTVLTKGDDFSFGFDLRLRDIAIGVDPAKPYTFEIAIGFCRYSSVTNRNFFRGAGVNATYGPRNLVEFDYFPDSGFGATVAPTAVSTNNRIRFSDNHPLELVTNILYGVTMTYTASNQVLRTVMTQNGAPFGAIRDLSLAGFPDFRVDTFAVISYSDALQMPPQFAGSILAHGTVDNVHWTVPEPPMVELVGTQSIDSFQVRLQGASNWLYRLEATTNMFDWRFVTEQLAPTNGPLQLETSGLLSRAMYRVIADRP